MPTVPVKVRRLHPDACMPQYSHTGAQGDLAADLFCVESVSIRPGEVRATRTGIALEFPNGYGALVEDRSGLALKGVCTLGGVIDVGYRGEVIVVLCNSGGETVEVQKGDRIAQIRIVARIQAEFIEADRLGPSPRGEKGFGSTGN